MSAHLHAICFLANDPQRLARFWSGLLGWQPDGDTLVPPGGTGYRLRFVATDQPKTLQNWAHFDLTSESLDDQRRTVARVLELGGRHAYVGQLPEEKHVVLADPEGNEVDVIEPGNNFLAGCGFTGALACDGSQEVGYFWSAALGWPLVWDENQETAVQSPGGGTKITWGGPPLMPRPTLDRVRFDLVPADGSTQRSEAERLLSLGATRLEAVGADPGEIALADPDGTRFHLLPPR